MSPRLWEHRVVDILEAIRKIQTYVEGVSFGDFQSDPKTVDAVILSLSGRRPGAFRRRLPTSIRVYLGG